MPMRSAITGRYVKPAWWRKIWPLKYLYVEHRK